VVLVDGWFQFGGVQTALNIHSSHSLADLVPYTSHLEPEVVSSVLVAHQSGLQVLRAPSELGQMEAIHPAHPGPTVTMLQEMFDHVVVDAWPFLDTLALALLDVADVVLLILTPEVSSLPRAKLWLHMAERRGSPPSRVHLLLNQDSGQAGFGQRDIARLLGYPLLHTLPSEPRLARHALSRGVPLVLGGDRGALAQSLRLLAQRTNHLESLSPEATPPRPGGY
jgi:pilus assembly protein CpaE